MSSIEGKTVAITGAGGGIGKAIAQRFAADGATVVASDIDEDGLASLDGMITTRCDVSSYDDVKAMVDLAVERTGRLDVLVNNAGIAVSGPVAELDPDGFALLQSVHVNGCFYGMRAALGVMLDQGEGHIVNVISRVAETRTPGMSAYASAKAAMWSLTRIAAEENADKGIRINALFPGISRSGMTEGGQLGDPDSLGEPDQHYDDFLHLATLGPDEPNGQVWVSGQVYPMFQESNDLGDLQQRVDEGEGKR